MVTSKQCLLKFGDPFSKTNEAKFMTMLELPAAMQAAFAHVTIFGTVGLKHIYCNKITAPMLLIAFQNLIDRGIAAEFHSYDGCHQLRNKKGQNTLSLHCWGLPIDLNANENTWGGIPDLSAEFVRCFIDAGFEWGGYWQKKDGMHFQPAKI